MKYGLYTPNFVDVTLNRVLEAGRKAARDVIIAALNSGKPLDMTAKDSYDGTPGGDIRTVADEAAQNAMDEMRRSRMPDSGVRAEEFGLRVSSTMPGNDGYWTFDGVDGTKNLAAQLAAGRVMNEVRGVCTMAAFVFNGAVVAAGIRAISGSDYVLLQSRSGEVLGNSSTGQRDIRNSRPFGPSLSKGVALTSGDTDRFGPLVDRLLSGCGRTRHVDHSSIGMNFRQLWTGGVQMYVQPHRNATPWDDTPCNGIGLAAGFTYLRPAEDGQALEEFEPEIVTEVTPRPYATISVHRSRLPEVAQVVPLRQLHT